VGRIGRIAIGGREELWERVGSHVDGFGNFAGNATFGLRFGVKGENDMGNRIAVSFGGK
jgi:hypothetical protein